MTDIAQEIGFFNPIFPCSKGHTQANEKMSWLGRIVEPYFDLGQQSFRMLPGTVLDDSVPIIENKREPSKSWFHTAGRVLVLAIKLISYLTIAIPFVMLLGKLIYREENSFTPQATISEEQLQAHLNTARRIMESNDLLDRIEHLDFTKIDSMDETLDLLQLFNQYQSEFTAVRNGSPVALADEEYTLLEDAEASLIHLKKRLNTEIQVKRMQLFTAMTDCQIKLEEKLVAPEARDRLELVREVEEELAKLYQFINQFRTSLGASEIEHGRNFVVEGRRLFKDTLVRRVATVLRPKGIRNLGASCYMNSAIQTLIANPEFRRRIKEETHPGYEHWKNEMARQLGLVLRKGQAFYGDRTERIVNFLFNEWQALPLNDLKAYADRMNNKNIGKALDALIRQQEDRAVAVAQEAAVDPSPQDEQFTLREEIVVNVLKENFPSEERLLLTDNQEIDWKQRKQLLKAFRINLLEYARRRAVMEKLRAFVLKYEDGNTTASSLAPFAAQFRAALHYANELPEGLYAQNDPDQVFTFVLDTIGATIPLTMKRTSGTLESVKTVQEPMVRFDLDKAQEECTLQELVNKFSREIDNGGLTTMGEVDTCNFTNEEGHDVTVNEWKVQFRIEGEPPQYLPIQLKRFYNDSEGNRKKIDTLVRCDSLEVDLASMFNLPEGQKALYRLVASVNHNGGLGGGHYYAAVKKSGQWSTCNDGQVTPLRNPANEIANGYIYFLERV